METSTPNMFITLTRRVLGLTLYDMMRSSSNFEDVKAALNHRTDWSIELFRSCLTIHLSNGGGTFVLSTLSFLVMAESMHLRYARLSPAELKECAESMGYVAFSILIGVLDIGSIIVRVAGLVMLSGSPAVATGLVIASTSPSIVFPILTYPARLFKRKKQESRAIVEMEAGATDDESRNEAL